MTTWFTSDLHLGHARIIELCNRPFSSVDEMNERIIENWNDNVQEDDTVYVLGDVALGTLGDSLPLCEQLAGRKYLVPGNHDRVWSGYSKKGVRELDILRYEEAGFTILENIETYKGWKLCHFPTSGDSHTDDRFPEYRPSILKDEWLIHGHVHNMWRINRNQINVGVDVWFFKPVREDVIQNIIDACQKNPGLANMLQS